MATALKTKPQVATMNAVHDLPVLVARDEGYFKDEGLDIEFVTTPGMAQATTSHFVRFDSVFDRPLDSVYNEGGIDQYRMCEWGIMKRAVEAESQHLRGRKIVALGASMSKFAIVVSKDSKIYEPEMLKDKDAKRVAQVTVSYTFYPTAPPPGVAQKPKPTDKPG